MRERTGEGELKMSNDQNELEDIVNDSLDRAEEIWNQVAPEMRLARAQTKGINIPSDIPGFSSVDIDQPQVSDFVVIVADIRDSTKHLIELDNSVQIDGLKRVFLENSALCPLADNLIRSRNGVVTEYLGDGVLGFIQPDSNGESNAIGNACIVGQKIIDSVQSVVNPILNTRFSIPNLNIGVGVGFGKSVVTAMGYGEYWHPKVFGRAVYDATKLAAGNNKLIISEPAKLTWKTVKGGSLICKPIEVRGHHGFEVKRKN